MTSTLEMQDSASEGPTLHDFQRAKDSLSRWLWGDALKEERRLVRKLGACTDCLYKHVLTADRLFHIGMAAS